MAKARVRAVHELAGSMPHVSVVEGPSDDPDYQVGGKSFVFFRTPRPDAVDPETGERYPDVIIFWVASESDDKVPRAPATSACALRRLCSVCR